MTEKVLSYERPIVPQETGWWCGPASVQILLNARGVRVPEAELANEIEQLENPGRGDDRDGTDHISLAATVLNRRLPGAKYTVVEMPNDPPSKAQRDALRRNIIRSINAGYGVIANIVSPPGNRFKPAKGSIPFAYPQWGTIWHYLDVMGYDDVVDAYWIADPGFSPHGGWVTHDSLATLIPPKGYAYSAAPVPTPEPPKPVEPQPDSFKSPLRSLDGTTGVGWGTEENVHVLLVAELASLGHPPTLQLLTDLANADPVRYPNRQEDRKIAQAILNKLQMKG